MEWRNGQCDFIRKLYGAGVGERQREREGGKRDGRERSTKGNSKLRYF